jgi:hypothetical protein
MKLENNRLNEPGKDHRQRQFFIRIFLGMGILIGLGFLVLALLFFAPLFMSDQPYTYAVALADLDGDGDLDAFYANGKNEAPSPNTMLMNLGGAQEGRPGKFKDSGQRLGSENSRSVRLGDLDNNGDLDAWVANIGYQSIFLNNSRGRFAPNTQSLIDERLGGTGLWAIALGDMDGDGDLDAVGAGCCGALESSPGKQVLYPPFNLVWINQGGAQGGQAGLFQDSGQTLESLGARGVALGDLDGDGDLDAFFGNDAVSDLNADPGPAQPDTVWWNDGHARLTDSGQRLGQARTMDVALGDLDADGDLDAYCAIAGPDEIWLNAGGLQGSAPGQFLDSRQRLGEADSRGITLADLDGDQDLDAAVVALGDTWHEYYVEIWLNDGRGYFSDSGQRLSHLGARAFSLGDLDGDGDVDVLAGWHNNGYYVWENQGDGRFDPLKH